MRLTIREALLAFRRAPLLSALSVMTIAFSLFAFGLFGLVALNVRQALAAIEERVEIRAFVLDGTPVEAIATAMGDLAAFPEVARVEAVTPEQALARARVELGEFRDVYDAAFLPASIEVRLKPGFRDPATVRAVAERVEAYPFVEEVRYGQEWVEKLHGIRNVATAAGLTLGLAFAGVSVIIIGATIRLTVLARAREIAVMRLVGATDAFVRRPFLLEGFLKGVLGGACALAMTWVAHALVTHYLIDAAFFDRAVAAAGIAFGALIGLLGSAVSVRRQLRRV